MKAPKEYWIKLKSFIKECRRVLHVTKKPSREEFKAVVKVTGLGILLIGFIGFIITLTAKLLGL
ncbi:MAG: protein translocase SEC61 complex subunit gamma [Nanoarchaeota archaeon]|nr:protein translocase SEC61 complex subunit gamma [Nanoarchaeota archaeon]